MHSDDSVAHAESQQASVHDLYGMAISAWQSGDLAGSAAKAQQVLGREPGHVGALEIVGILLLQQGEVSAAYGPLRLVAHAQALGEISQYRLAEAAQALGRVEEAIQALRRAILANPEAQPALSRLIGVLMARGAFSEALPLADRIVWLGVLDSAVFSLRGSLRKEVKSPKPAGSDMMRTYILAPESSQNLFQCVVATQWSGDPNRAERLIRRYCYYYAASDPRGWEVYYDLLAQRRRRHEVTRHLKRALALTPGNPGLWSRMCQAEWQNPSRGFAEIATAVSAPSDPYAWIKVLQALIRYPEQSNWSMEAKIRAEEAAPSAPLVRFSLAELAFATGQFEEARRHLQLFFREVSATLVGRNPDARQDTGTLYFLYYLMYRGDPDLCRYFAERVDPLVGGNSDAAAKLVQIRLMLQMIASYRADAHTWQSERRRIVSVPVWGEEYVDMWLKYGLASLFGERNRQYWEDGETVFQIFSTPEDWARLQDAPLFRRHCHLFTAKFIDITPVLVSGLPSTSYMALLLSHWVSIFVARDEGADFMGLVADYIFADGSLSHLADLFENKGKRSAFTVDFWVSITGTGVYDEARSDDGTLSVSAREMSDIFCSHTSSRIHFNEAGPELESIPSDPSRIYNRIPNGLRIDNLQPQLFYARPEVLRNFWFAGFPMTDNWLVDMVHAASGTFDDMEMLVDGDLFGCTVLDFDEEKRAATGHYPPRISSTDPIEDLAAQIRRSKLWSPGREWALKHPLYVTNDAKSPQSAVADEFMGDVVGRLQKANRAIQIEMAREIGLPAFDAFLDEIRSQRNARQIEP